MAREKGDAARARAARLGPCIVLVGGPYNGWWYTAADWKIRLEAEKHMIASSTGREPHFALYDEGKSSEVKMNPDRNLEGLVGRVWRWTGPDNKPARGRKR